MKFSFTQSNKSNIILLIWNTIIEVQDMQFKGRAQSTRWPMRRIDIQRENCPQTTPNCIGSNSDNSRDVSQCISQDLNAISEGRHTQFAMKFQWKSKIDHFLSSF